MKRKLVYDEVGIKKKCSVKEHEDEGENDRLCDFEPWLFFRCHSKKNDAADVQTQIWQCAFEPESSKSRLVATCGGNSVCFIDVDSGVVEGKYYSDDVSDVFYSICWTTISDISNEENIIAVGGFSRDIHLLHPKEGVVFFKHRILKRKGKSQRSSVVCSLLFHPFEKNVLFCGQSDGNVCVFDIGKPCPPHYKTKFNALYTLSAESEIFTLSFCSTTDVLLSACNDGLRGWKILEEENMNKAQLMCFEHPLSQGAKYGGGQLVDSVEALGKGLVATKCALHGKIYVWNLKQTLLESRSQSHLRISPRYVLKWRDTDNYFMNMGHHEGCRLLVCGDDQGALWVYSTLAFSSGCHRNKSSTEVEPKVILPWPQIHDVHSDKKRKLRLDVYDIVVDKVCVDSAGDYIVAVTANNMVCIWKRLK